MTRYVEGVNPVTVTAISLLRRPGALEYPAEMYPIRGGAMNDLWPIRDRRPVGL